jgi:flagellar hook-length control protein FliK
MTAQSVKTQPMDLSRAATKHKVKGSPNRAGFDQVMDNNLKTTVVNKDQAITRQKAVAAKAKEVVEEVIRERSKVNPDINSDSISKAEELGLVDDAIPVKDILLDKTDDDLLIPDDQLLEILGSIQQAIMDVLNIDLEQLAKQMDDLGIENLDLLNPDTLRQLVLSSNGKSEVTAFLTDENLVKSVSELLENVDAILSDVGIDLSEDELKAFTEKLHNIMVANKEDKDEISHNSQRLQEDVSSGSVINKENQLLDDSLVQDIIRQNTLAIDDPSEKAMSQQTRADDASTKSTNSKVADTVDGKASNVMQTRELEFSQTDQDDNSNEMNPKNEFDGFIDAMINVTQKTQQVDIVANGMQITEFREIANQIIEQIKVTVLEDQSSMELQLNPENLGKVNLSVQSRDGVLTAQFVVNNDIVKEAIESQMVVLKDSLEQQGLRVETIEVTVASYSFDQRHESNSSEASKEQQQTRRKITFDEAVHMSELPQDEEGIDNLSSELGNRIDYTA